MLSCFGLGKVRNEDVEAGEREPLLPQYDDETSRQSRLREKLHTYQMLRAISQGYMPSNEQIIVHLRSLLSADILHPAEANLSTAGRALIRCTKIWLDQFIQLLQHKNSQDQVQDFLWYLAKARLDADLSDIGGRAAASKAKANVSAAIASLQTIASLLLSNGEFRLFMADLTTVGREVFRDTAFTLADVSRRAAKATEPPVRAVEAVKGAENGDAQAATSKQELEEQVGEVATLVANGAVEVAEEAGHSVSERLGGDEGKAIVRRMKQVILKLVKRKDYRDSASMLSMLLQRYVAIYAQIASDTVQAMEDTIGSNEEVDEAGRNFWIFITSFGDAESWALVEASFKELVEAGKTDGDLINLVQELWSHFQRMLLDPEFFEETDKWFKDLRESSSRVSSASSISECVDRLLAKLAAALHSVAKDEDLARLLSTSRRLAGILSPSGHWASSDLVEDSINTFVPLLIQAIQYLPIPRIEISTPAFDLLVENLVLEPGRTVNRSSFFPYKLRVSTRNDFEVRKAHVRTTSSLSSFLQVKVEGLSLAAEDVGYWMRLHSWALGIVDSGLASFHLDERGIDVTLDVEIGRDRMEEMVSLRGVDVRVHHLDYTLRRSRFSCVAWLLKPIMRRLVRKAVEVKIATSIDTTLRTLNRELLFARERLRATRIAGPSDLWTFIRAVATRLAPAPEPDVEARVGVRPGGGVFQGRYAPGSLVKMWEDEGCIASQKVFEYQKGGWRNEIFGLRTRPASDRGGYRGLREPTMGTGIGTGQPAAAPVSVASG
ncbi:bactericidal permeability-increasing protein [Drechmeria coniospora]|uniref:Bactericidal permeability-increasing protein n=1 Tax=Drechmeria coniospora TaxID=98403 RepID=A0A151GHN5_DRECN|nr:bactericidal permeability-increasing protein [Drechmeria coniospora]KYK56590.1 bactericidal permeability-increasing protein [Drechmeria coniospora]